MEKNPKQLVFSYRFPNEELKEELEQKAKSQFLSLNQIITRVLVKYAYDDKTDF